MRRNPTITVVLLLLCALGTGCARRGRDAGDDRDVSTGSDSPPVVEAFFAIDSGGDQMTDSPGRARLMLVVRSGAEETRHEIVRCEEAALGSALGGGGGEVLEVAGCDGEMRLQSSGGFLRVVRLGESGQTELRAIRLPNGVERAVSPEPREGQDH